ncbi:MAG: hypothetical protein GX755_02995 [Syntrophomonadaceae bacterium]|nr:hypothetical protein [Syntrophomonadaceae bacterium]
MEKKAKYSREYSFLAWGEKLEKWLVRFVIFGLVALVVTQTLMTQDPFRFYLSFAERLEAQRMGSDKLPESKQIQPALVPTKPEDEVNQINSGLTEEFNSNDLIGLQPATSETVGTITLELINFSSMPKATVLVNGQEVADFREKRVTIPVRNDDILEINGSYYQHSLTVLILDVSENVRYPKKKQEIKVNQSLTRIGQVTLKTN